MDCFTIYQLMYLILDELNDENNYENLTTYLTDADPFMRRGETSVDEVVYTNFKDAFSKYDNKDDYSYKFICEYLKNLDSYYGDIYSIFITISKEEFIDTCNNILDNHPEKIKKII